MYALAKFCATNSERTLTNTRHAAVTYLDNSERCRTLWHHHCTACRHVLAWDYCNHVRARHHHTKHCMVTMTTSHRQLCVSWTGANHRLAMINQAPITVVGTNRFCAYVFAYFGQVCATTNTHARARTHICMHAHTKPAHTKLPSYTWTRLSLAWLCGYTTARLAAVFWRGVTASASMHAIAASNRAFIAPFAPAPIHNVAVVVEIAPVSRTTDRQAERVNAGEITSLRTHATALLTPGKGDCAMQIVAVGLLGRGQRSINSACNEGAFASGR